MTPWQVFYPTAGGPNKVEVAIGRTAAVCVHPFAAWRSTRRSFRALVVAGYFLLGFVGAFTALLLG